MAKTRSIRLKPAPSPKGLSPIFILGIEKRCGTNYLQRLLSLHPDCRSFPLQEDSFLDSAELLQNYANSVVFTNRWSWHPSTQEQIFNSLGRGLQDLIQAQYPKHHVVLKTPTCRGIRFIFRLFPESRLIVLVRDGRDTIESHVQTWNTDYEKAMHRWASSAKELLPFLEEHAKDPRLTLVRYEDLFGNTRKEMKRIIKSLGLSQAKYRFKAAENLPVYGSSVFRDRRDPWRFPKAVSSEFRPVGKTAHWPSDRKALYNKLVGRYARALGNFLTR